MSQELREKIEYILDGYIPETNDFNQVVNQISDLLSTATQEAVERERVRVCSCECHAFDIEHKSSTHMCECKQPYKKRESVSIVKGEEV